jgi:hypothetical protein
LFAVILIGATAWTTMILIQQKQAWQAYAKRKNLNFDRGKFFAPCTVDGLVDGYTVSLFTATQQNPEARKNRQVTVFQITDPNPYVDGIACGTAEMKNFLLGLDTLSAHNMADKDWNNTHLIYTRNKEVVDAFLTAERAKILNNILSFPGADVLILLDDAQGVFRFETANPMTDADKIDSTIQKLISRFKKLHPSEAEVKEYKRLKKQIARDDDDDEPAEVHAPAAVAPLSAIPEETAAEDSGANDDKVKEKPVKKTPAGDSISEDRPDNSDDKLS